MSLQTMISKRIKELYDFHDYDVSKDKIIRISELILKSKPDLSEKDFNEFIDFVELGKYGILYRIPTCILSMFQQYKKDNAKLMP